MPSFVVSYKNHIITNFVGLSLTDNLPAECGHRQRT